MSNSDQGTDQSETVPGQPRQRTMTEEGATRYATLRDQHYANINTVFGKIRVETENIETYGDDLEALQAVQNRLSSLTARHEALVTACQDFLTRSKTEQSRKDNEDFQTTINDHRKSMDGAFAQIQTLTSGLIEREAPRLLRQQAHQGLRQREPKQRQRKLD